ncbi:DUF4838 domain-containing protein [bacterium]|nr:DUF4838 domain-containing protein [bacterium]
MKPIKQAWIGGALLLAGCAGLDAAPLTIVADGRPNAVIIAAAETNAALAAAEIQRYVEKMSGAKLAIVTEGQEPAGPARPVRLYVGHTAAAKKSGVKIPAGHDPSIRPDAFEEEGYVLRTKGNNIFVGGNSDGPYHGTIYGAYAFLEKLGCRWYFPGDWGEVVPEQQTVTVPPLAVESHPDFALRYIGLNPGWVPTTTEELSTYRDWCFKVGFAPSHVGTYPNVGDGFLGIHLPPKDFWETHPEYYAMDKKGNRHIGEGDVNHTTMLCLSNPDVFTQVLQNLNDAFAGKRDGHRIYPNGFGLSPPDGSPYCYCEKCAARSQNFEYPDYVYGPQMSEEFFDFAARLAREFPDKYVATMAYSLRELPPQGVQLLPNMTVYHAPISCCALHPNNHPGCWRRREFVKILAQYRRQTPHVYLYEYNPNFLTGLFVPERQTANAAVNIPLYKELDIKGINAEGRKAVMQTWTSYYVIAKLLWDADTDVAALKQEFYSTFFGPEAGPHVQAWWNAVEQRLLEATIHGHEDFLINNVYTLDFIRSIRRHIDAALKAKASAAQRERVAAVALIADHLAAYAAMEAAEMNLDYAAAIKAAERMDAAQQKLHAIYPFFISETFPDTPTPPSFIVRGRLIRSKELLAKTNGEKGRLVAPLPLEMKFVRDRFNEGVIGEWYAPGFDDRQWPTKNTFFTWDAQDEPEDDRGHDYNGYGWYRGTFQVPGTFKNQPVKFHCGGALNEAWIWVNGQYAGHSEHKIWWWHPHDFEIDVTALVKPGKNTIAIRVWNKAELGGLFRRGFLWSPKQ